MYWTNFAEDRILRTFLGGSVSAPPVMHAALYLSNPGETGAGTEIQYTGYQRQPVVFSTPAVEPGGTSIANVDDIGFPTAPAAAGTVTHVALFDSVSGGNMWAFVTLDEPIVVQANVAPLIQSAEWVYTTSGNFSAWFKQQVLNVLRGVNVSGFTPYVALYNGNPDSGGSELSGGNYNRFAVAFGAPEVQPAGQSMISVTTSASSPRANTNWGTWTHTALCDAASGGQVVAFVARSSEYAMGAGKAAFVNPGDLSVSLN